VARTARTSDAVTCNSDITADLQNGSKSVLRAGDRAENIGHPYSARCNHLVMIN
jgi:hypothetical protein